MYYTIYQLGLENLYIFIYLFVNAFIAISFNKNVFE